MNPIDSSRDHGWFLIFSLDIDTAKEFLAAVPKNSRMRLAQLQCLIPVLLMNDYSQIEHILSELSVPSKVLTIQLDEYFPWAIYPNITRNAWIHNHRKSVYTKFLKEDLRYYSNNLLSVFDEEHTCLHIDEYPGEEAWSIYQIVFFLMKHRLITRPLCYPTTIRFEVPKLPLEPLRTFIW